MGALVETEDPTIGNDLTSACINLQISEKIVIPGLTDTAENTIKDDTEVKKEVETNSNKDKSSFPIIPVAGVEVISITVVIVINKK